MLLKPYNAFFEKYLGSEINVVKFSKAAVIDKYAPAIGNFILQSRVDIISQKFCVSSLHKAIICLLHNACTRRHTKF